VPRLSWFGDDLARVSSNLWGAYDALPQNELEYPHWRWLMNVQEFFLEQYDTVRWIVRDLFLKGLTDDQIRHQPEEGLNSIALVSLAYIALAGLC
jgi:hypothetical protein